MLNKVKHIGCGRIGLGLVYPKLIDAGVYVELHDRNNKRRNKINDIGFKIHDKLYKPNIKSLNDIKLNNGDVVSTSVKPENIENLFRELNNTLEEETEIFYIPFENIKFSNKDFNFEYLKIKVINSIIDRIITDIIDFNVICETFEGKLFIDKNKYFEVPKVISGEIEDISNEKLKTVNGSHLMIALKTMELNYISIDEFIKKENKIFNKIIEICCLNQKYITSIELKNRLIETAKYEKVERLINRLDKKIVKGERLQLNRTKDSSNFIDDIILFSKTIIKQDK